jgi:hypothetical protein
MLHETATAFARQRRALPRSWAPTVRAMGRRTSTRSRCTTALQPVLACADSQPPHAGSIFGMREPRCSVHRGSDFFSSRDDPRCAGSRTLTTQRAARRTSYNRRGRMTTSRRARSGVRAAGGLGWDVEQGSRSSASQAVSSSSNAGRTAAVTRTALQRCAPRARALLRARASRRSVVAASRVEPPPELERPTTSRAPRSAVGRSGARPRAASTT